MADKKNIVHEADTQRHHVRVHLPANLDINGVTYKVKDWSTAGARLQIEGEIDTSIFKEKKLHNAQLLLDFNGYGLSIPLRIEIRYIKDEDECVGIRYADMSTEQISIMQHLVSSYVTGELTSIGDLINVVGRNNFSKPRNIPACEEEAGFTQRMKRSLLKLGIAFISLLLLAYVAAGIYEQTYVVSAQRATVAAQSFPLMTPSGGTVNYKNISSGALVKKGDVLITVLSDSGTVTGIDSPCDCIVEELLAVAGKTVIKNEAVLSLIPDHAKLYVEAYVTYEKAIRIAKGQKAHLKLSGAQLDLFGHIENISMGKTTEGQSRVIIHTQDKIPGDLIGTPAEVKIDTLGWMSR